MVIELKTSSTTAKIDTLGAELISLQDASGREYVWQKDKRFWGRSSPVLFPIVGGLRNNKTMIDGQEYTMAKHGFARDTEFHVTRQTENSVVMTMTHSEETLRIYPYRFSLSIAYTLDEEKISFRYTVENPDQKPMEYFLGAHPAFQLPVGELGEESFQDYCLEFEHPETAGCPKYDLKLLHFDVNNRIDWTNGTNRIMLDYSQFDNDAILFDRPASRKVKLYNTKTGHGIEVRYPDFESIAFWTPIGLQAPFLCIEPWNGMGACSDEGNTFSEKRGVQRLNPGEQKSYQMDVVML